ncbi:hypothetical protein [Bacillus cereus group sp. BfR-BA-01360]|uniref:hypothetical protein n=1 Tax=Bacillus cereus group sp. BfR-BA-01360 TaxID=2920321 RepID=UPI001F59CAB1|nr:hypothetical protein [Bacillus cereus group sp. BfR-BA-01360]
MSNSIEVGKWMINEHADGIWSGPYFNTREEAIEEGKKEYFKSRETFYVGQVSKEEIAIGINVDSVLDDIVINVQEQVGEVADDYLNHVDKEDYQVLEERLLEVVQSWMKERDYEPSYFKIVNTECIDK